MTVLSFVKGVLRFISLFGIFFLGFGAWKAWTAYTFVQHSEKVEGSFKGYYTAESLPMYTYTDAQGRVHDETGREGHLFEHLSYGDKVKVLVAADGSGETRLGDIDSLYGNSILNFVIGLCFLFFINYGINVLDRYLGQPQPADTPSAYLEQLQQADEAYSYPKQPAKPADEVTSFFNSFLQEIKGFGQERLPISDMVVYFAGFLLIGGVMIAFTIHITMKRQDPALIKALEQRNYEAALALATERRGVEGQTAEGETALIMALKANKPEVARAILNCRFVNANVYTTDTKSSVQLAAANGDVQTLTLLLQKGASAFDIDPDLIHALIVKGDAATLELVFKNGFNLHQEYKGFSFGDYAVIEGQSRIVWLIQKHNGLFQAPEPFVALALNDAVALRTAQKRKNADKLRFCGYSLEQFAQKINRQTLLESIRNDK